MPTSIRYDYTYDLGGQPGGGTIYPFRATSGITFTDTADGNQNGFTTIPGQIGVEGVLTTTLYGLTSNGDPILFDGVRYAVYSNNGNLMGSLVGPVTSGVFAYCFAAGTAIATPKGERPVEDLDIGETVLTADGRAVPVRWVGRQTIVKLFAGQFAQLVRISAGALGNHTDLLVTGDHGMVLDGYVINASALINRTTIDWVPLDELPSRFAVYHVETEAHDVILANGAASESYLDMPGRSVFDNFQEYLDLYGGEQSIPEMPTPRITSRRLLPEAIRARLGIAGREISWNTGLSA